VDLEGEIVMRLKEEGREEGKERRDGFE